VYPTAPEPRARDIVTVGKLSWPEDPALVQAEGAQVSWIAPDASNAEPRLRVGIEERDAGSGGELTVRLRGKFDLGSFNKLVITASSGHDCYVHCLIRTRGLPFVGSANRARVTPREIGRPTTRAVLDLPGGRRMREAPDELELIFDNVHGPFTLGSIELCKQPVWAWLPAAESGFGMVDLEGDARSSVGLSSERTLETEVSVPYSATLRLSAVLPRALRRPWVQPILRVEVQGEHGRPLVQQLVLDTDPELSPKWQELSIPLESFGGQKVRIVYALNFAAERQEAACAMTRPRIAIAKRDPKTVLLITSDTHRADFVGAAASVATIKTPAIDALAKRGVLFEDCWSSTNVTIPSHVAIMTATSPRDSGVLDNYTPLSHEARTLAEAFQDAGFVTYAVVSAPHLSDAGSGLGQGFDRMSAPTDTNKRRSQASIDQMRSWIDEAEGQDLFLWLHVFDAHTPYAPPEEFERLYWPAGRDAYDKNLPEPAVPQTFRINLPEGVRDLDLLSARYSGEVSYLDHGLAALFEVPRVKAGVIALTADHGESLGEHGIYWEHAGLYPQTIHVPLILAWPAAPAGTRVKTPVFQLDLAQTLLGLAGVVDAGIPGSDLLAGRDRSGEPRFTISSGAERASVTKDNWHLIISLRKYLVTVGAEQQVFPKHHAELFDLAKDPACEHDLAHEEVTRATELRRILCAWLSSATPRGWAGRENGGPEMAQHLAQLGYTAPAGTSSINKIDIDCTCAECAPFLPGK
jgi:arylsulfatase A-like enzyme